MQPRTSIGSSAEDDASDTSLPQTDGGPTLQNVTSHNDQSIEHESSMRRDDTSFPGLIRSPSSFGRSLSSQAVRQHSRHQSNYSNFSTMSETSLPWTTSDIGLNAISGVLNDPGKRGKPSAEISKADVPAVPHASIPRMKPADFAEYLAHIAPVFEKYKFNKLADDNTNSSNGDATALLEDDMLPVHLRRSSRNPYNRPQLVMSSESLASDYQRELPMLEIVPSIFFDEEFVLDNPRTFDAVCENADIVGSSGNHLPATTNTILQEKLSYYLDIIEIHLLDEIEKRSPSFFEALSNLQSLHQQTLDCVAQIHRLRQKMKHIQATECIPGLEVIRLQVRRRNLEKLYNTIATVKDICSTQLLIQELLGRDDYFGALDLIEETRNALRSAEDIQNVRAVVNFDEQLGGMKSVVIEMIQLDFIGILRSDLSGHLETFDPEHSKEAQLRQEGQNALKERLAPSTMGLVLTDTMSIALQTYKTDALPDIEAIVEKKYPILKQSNLTSGHPSKMPFDSYFETLQGMFAFFLEMIECVSIYHQLLLCLIDENVERLSKERDTWTEWRLTVERESADIITAAVELAHKQCGKMVGYRNDNNAKLNATDFYRLCSDLRSFIRQSESFCGQTCSGLRGAVISQQRAFIDHFHMERMKQEIQLIENEQWIASDVPNDFQRIVDRISDGGISSFAESQDKPDTSNDESAKMLLVNGSKFYVVGCSLLILKMFEDYLRCIWNLEDRVGDVLQKLVELFKLFNSRVSKVILGAGAMRSAGLKNITAKHLALASQSLGAMICLIPSLKNCIEQYARDKHAVLAREFEEIDSAVEDYKGHQGEIYTKLVVIMNERITVHIKGMESIPWDEDTALKSKYMETLVKETKTLHKVLKKYLPADDLQSVMARVFDSFTEQFSQKLPSLKISTEQGKGRLSKDAEYFINELDNMQDAQLPCTVIRDAVNAITVDSTEEPTESP